MPFKPMTLKEYRRWISQYGWTLAKGIDLKLFDAEGRFQCQVKVIHPPGKEVDAQSVKKTRKKLQDAGLE